jgi:hypothetical protein
MSVDVSRKGKGDVMELRLFMKVGLAWNCKLGPLVWGNAEAHSRRKRRRS